MDFEDSSDLENLNLSDIEWTLILQFVSLMTYLSYVFLLDAFIFTTINEKIEEQKSALQIFLKDVTGEKTGQIHKHS